MFEDLLFPATGPYLYSASLSRHATNFPLPSAPGLWGRCVALVKPFSDNASRPLRSDALSLSLSYVLHYAYTHLLHRLSFPRSVYGPTFLFRGFTMIGNTDGYTRRMQDSMSMRKIYRVRNGYEEVLYNMYIYYHLDILERLKIET